MEDWTYYIHWGYLSDRAIGFLSNPPQGLLPNGSYGFTSEMAYILCLATPHQLSSHDPVRGPNKSFSELQMVLQLIKQHTPNFSIEEFYTLMSAPSGGMYFRVVSAYLGGGPGFIFVLREIK
jgi:hypothetical protein